MAGVAVTCSALACGPWPECCLLTTRTVQYFEGVSDLPGQNIARDGEPQASSSGAVAACPLVSPAARCPALLPIACPRLTCLPLRPPQPSQELCVDPLTDLPTTQHNLLIDRGMSFEAACARLEHERSGAAALWGRGSGACLTAVLSRLAAFRSLPASPGCVCISEPRRPPPHALPASPALPPPVASPLLQAPTTAAASAPAGAPSSAAPWSCWPCRSRARTTCLPSCGPTRVRERAGRAPLWAGWGRQNGAGS